MLADKPMNFENPVCAHDWLGLSHVLLTGVIHHLLLLPCWAEGEDAFKREYKQGS